jgi:hypothetical protein
MTLVHCFLLECVAFRDFFLIPGVIFGGSLCCCSEELITMAGLCFFFHFLFSFVHLDVFCDILLVHRFCVLSIFRDNNIFFVKKNVRRYSRLFTPQNSEILFLLTSYYSYGPIGYGG